MSAGVNRPAKLISGGQTGADMGGLRAGRILDITTGGWMPRNFANETGHCNWLRSQFGVQEHPSPAYSVRTRANVRDAAVTLIFGDLRSPGSRLTDRICHELGRIYLCNPTLEELATCIWPAGTVANIAGNRESVNRGLEEWVVAHLVRAWGSPELASQHPYPNIEPRFWSPAVERI